jgi:NADPH2:quinone reductase
MQYNAILLTKTGSPNVLQPVQYEVREPRADELCIKIHYCGLGYTDVIMRYGNYPYAPKMPFVPGYEIIGTVESVGANVHRFQVGQRVAALTVTGGYAEYIWLREDDLVAVPDGIDDQTAVSLILNYVTAYQMLHREANVKAGESILITGAAGGVGTALMELGRVAGVKIFGSASKAKHAHVEQFGGTPIDYTTHNVADVVRAAGGVDAAFDGIGGSHVRMCWHALKPQGRLVLYGFTGAVRNGKSELMPLVQGMMAFGLYKALHPSRVSFYGITRLYRKNRQPFKEDIQKLFALAEQGVVKPIVTRVFALSEVRTAHEILEAGKATGKMLIDCRA